MARATTAVCPHCGTPLKSSRGVRVGKTVTCPQCRTPFTVSADAPGEAAPPAGEINGDRLALVLVGALLCLFGGGLLTWYCFALNARAPAVAQVPPASHRDQPKEKDDAEPPPPTPPPSPVDPADERKIDDAIVKGVWYLRNNADAARTGTWGDNTPGVPGAVSVGLAALPGLTLLECGVPPGDPLVQKAAAAVRRLAPAEATERDTYQLALAILFLDRLKGAREEELRQAGATLRSAGSARPQGSDPDEDLLQFLALRLVAGQRADDGGWGYNCPPLARAKTQELLKLLRDAQKSLDDWRAAAGAASFDPGRSDNSNTQFAVLALWVAGRHGVPIERTIKRVEDRLRGTQQPDGSWFYSPAANDRGGNAWQTMTCSGLLGLAVAHGAAGDAGGRKPLDDPAIRKALTRLAAEIDRPDDKRDPDFYFLWSLERVAVLFRLDKIDTKDWYAWGSRELRSSQNKGDGSWDGQVYTGSSPVVSTCFALLFLKRANLVQDLTDKLRLLSEKK